MNQTDLLSVDAKFEACVSSVHFDFFALNVALTSKNVFSLILCNN